MTIIVDAAPIISLSERREPRNHVVSRILRTYPGRLILPAPVTAEVDYLLQRRNGPTRNLPFLQDLARGSYEVECLLPEEYTDVVALQRRYPGFAPGLADLSIVVLARRFNTRRILTFDERHFRAMAPLQGGEFEILPGSGDQEPSA